MRKVAVVTIIGLNNYGNRLQNYAMQSILNRLGYNAETIKTKSDLKRRIKTSVLYYINPLLPAEKKTPVIRRKRFNDFENNIVYSRIIKPNDNGEKLLNNYDYVVYGSDQIWNTEFQSFSKLFLGYHAAREKNVAVSASFGKSDISPQYIELFKTGLQNFKAISVRENSGINIVRKYASIECIVTPDPTLAISEQEWEKLERRIDIPEDFTFSYFLGECPSFRCQESFNISGNVNTEFGPSEFLYLIHHAKTVYTDSFHACVFSIIFRTPFYIFKRESMYSSMMDRIDTLLGEFDISIKKELNYYYISEEELSKQSIDQKIDELTSKLENFLTDSFASKK